ncbi:aspartate carbamoyltransferase catalytic subunit [Halobacillus salinarum]|uniref:Aspartate carbamoyltransferase n=1 Tax=Halobacillus salinarum TaxID=2932257 RepID=A0ABY4EGJ0_9BACI|nr:aspartate carbamoyltransferase catalytic subunit [Halobacillus salinarum]UOQ43115.1 aspartate carbamoyltransferase catalytic subunit [Halobacillus salinarum]
MKHLHSMTQLTNKEIEHIIHTAKSIENKQLSPNYSGRFAANIFLEPSTRTKHSFYMAERRLGLEVVDLEEKDSSLIKGESLYDTLKTLEALGTEIAIVRQSQNGLIKQITEQLGMSVINAGDGTGEHPTQSLLDLFTIKDEFGTFEGLSVVIAGDIKHSRVARSNAYALKNLGADVKFVAKPEWQDKTISDKYISIDEAVEECDVLMLLRIQHERHRDPFQSSQYLEDFGLTIEREGRMKRSSIILHPAPVNRGVEISASLVESEKSRIFKQMTNGVTIRMALLHLLLEEGI